MPFFFRSSVTAGPFRFNFSRGGVGVSVGVKGFRVGAGPRGHYVHAGLAGCRYRITSTRPGTRDRRAIPDPMELRESHAVHMIDIESDDVGSMRDAAFIEVLDEINAKARQWKMTTVLGWTSALLASIASIVFGPYALVVGPISILLSYLVGSWLDSFRRTTVLFYEFEPRLKERYKAVIEGFDTLQLCDRKWHIEAGGAVQDLTTWKRHAGATHLIRKAATKLEYKLPGVIRCNITPPALQVGEQVIYFFPDVALIEHGGRVGAVGYGDLNVKGQESNFIEDGRVPADALVVGRTWKHPNKNGGPDRRFNANYEIPVCKYDALHLSSESGLNELLQFSKAGVASTFVKALGAMPKAVLQAAPKLLGS
jgi:hypothetical protein